MTDVQPLPTKFWVAFRNDGSVMIPFRQEIDCLRAAHKQCLQVGQAKFGDDLMGLTIVDAEIVEDEVTA